MDRRLFKDKKVLVMGLGRFGGGVDVVKFACKAGMKVIITDLAKREELTESIGQLEGLKVEYRLGFHDPADFQQSGRLALVASGPLERFSDKRALIP